jgi:hypothetical protein
MPISIEAAEGSKPFFSALNHSKSGLLIAKRGVSHKSLFGKARSQESGVRSQEEELEGDKNSLKFQKVIGK